VGGAAIGFVAVAAASLAFFAALRFFFAFSSESSESIDESSESSEDSYFFEILFSLTDSVFTIELSPGT